jgi:glycosyltransferase involved in cell wall biosynthesis
LERNQGLGGARNVGLLASSGEYITFLDDDDIRLPQTLDEQIEMLEREPRAGLVYGQAIIRSANARPAGEYPRECHQGNVFWQLLARNFIPCGSAVFRRSCLSRIGLLNDSIAGIEDWDLWIRIAEIYDVLVLPKPVLIWRKGEADSSQYTSRADQMVSRCVKQFREWMKLPRVCDAGPQTRRVVLRRFSENMMAHLLYESSRAVRHGHALQAMKNLAVLPQLSPLTILRLARFRLLRLERRPIENVATVAK